MNGVTIPGVPAGSNHVGASEMWTPQVTWPSGAAAAGTAAPAEISRTRTVTERRGLIMSLQPGGAGGGGLSLRECSDAGEHRGSIAGQDLLARLLTDLSVCERLARPVAREVGAVGAGRGGAA